MPISDTKKAQTVVNLFRDRVTRPIAQADAVAAAIKNAVVANGLTGQFTTGELTALNQFVTDLAALAASPVVAAIEARYVDSHRSQAITIEGVN